MESNRTRGLMLAAAAAGLFALAPLAVQADEGASASKLGACFGVNACKGKSSCKTAHSGCKGLNGCKGQGFIEEVSADTCAQLDGKFRTYEDVQKEQAGH